MRSKGVIYTFTAEGTTSSHCSLLPHTSAHLGLEENSQLPGCCTSNGGSRRAWRLQAWAGGLAPDPQKCCKVFGSISSDSRMLNHCACVVINVVKILSRRSIYALGLFSKHVIGTPPLDPAGGLPFRRPPNLPTFGKNPVGTHAEGIVGR